MSDAATKARALARTAPLIREAGGDPDALRPVLDEYINDEPDADPDEILAVMKSQVPEAFKGNDAAEDGSPPDVELGSMTEDDKMDFIDKHGVAAYTRLVKRRGEKMRAEMQRRYRGF